MLQFALKVVEIKQETDDTITICFKQPGLKKIKYLAGQYLTLIFRINNRRYLRPYSFSSAPGTDLTLNVTIKRVPGGIISNYIADCVKPGDIIEVMEPIGDFTLESKNIPDNNHLVFWGAGSGITPLFSIIKYALTNDLSRHITLVYGNHNHESTIFNQQINDLQKKYPTKFSITHFHTKAIVYETTSAISHGRINPEKIVEVLKKENNDLSNTYHFVCGPNGLSESIKSVLFNEGVLQEHIFSESFELVVRPEDFEGISTQNVLIKNATAGYLVEVIKGKTILEAGLDALIDLNYSCQTGTCLLCRAKLVTGKLKSMVNSSQNKMLAKDEYLLCCSLPLTNDIELLVS